MYNPYRSAQVSKRPFQTRLFVRLSLIFQCNVNTIIIIWSPPVVEIQKGLEHDLFSLTVLCVGLTCSRRRRCSNCLLLYTNYCPINNKTTKNSSLFMFDLIESWRGCETVIIGLCWQEDVRGPAASGLRSVWGRSLCWYFTTLKLNYKLQSPSPAQYSEANNKN